jgi:hypothetical protein
VDIPSVSGTSRHGFKSRQGMRFLGKHSSAVVYKTCIDCVLKGEIKALATKSISKKYRQTYEQNDAESCADVGYNLDHFEVHFLSFSVRHFFTPISRHSCSYLRQRGSPFCRAVTAKQIFFFKLDF